MGAWNMGRMIAVANQKGGVGKTTTAVNLAACLAAAGKKTLLIDTDPQGNATSGVGVEKDGVEKSVYQAIVGECTAQETILQTAYDNLFLCPANVDLAGAEIELVDMPDREFRMKHAFADIRQEYAYLIVDCPPSLGLLTLNAFTAVDSVLVPIQCEYYALEGLSQLTKTIRKVKSGLNPAIELEGVLLTMFDGRLNLTLQVVQEVKKYFGNKVYKTTIPRNVRLSEAPSYGMPVNYYDRSSSGSEAYMFLAAEVVKNNK